MPDLAADTIRSIGSHTKRALYIKLAINDKPMYFLVAAGATVTVVDEDWWRLNDLPPLQYTSKTITGVSNQPLSITGVGHVQLSAEGLFTDATVYVMPELWRNWNIRYGLLDR